MIGEVFPTKVRSTAIGICGTVARLSNITVRCVTIFWLLFLTNILFFTSIPKVQLVYGFLINKPNILLLVASAFMTLGCIATACTGIDEMAQEPLQDVTAERHAHVPIIEDIELVSKKQSEKEVGQVVARKSYTQVSVDRESE